MPACARQRPALCDPVDYSPPGFTVYGVFQGRILEWLPLPTLGDLPNPSVKPGRLASPALAGRFFPTSATWEAPDQCLARSKHSVNACQAKWALHTFRQLTANDADTQQGLPHHHLWWSSERPKDRNLHSPFYKREERSRNFPESLIKVRGRAEPGGGVCSAVSCSWRPRGPQPIMLLCPRGSPGKNTRVGCHFLLRGSPWPRDQTHISCGSCTAGRFFTAEPQGKSQCWA